jgi:regulatory protein
LSSAGESFKPVAVRYSNNLLSPLLTDFSPSIQYSDRKMLILIEAQRTDSARKQTDLYKMDFQKQRVTYQEALKKASELCSRSEKCSWDIEQKCHEWQLSAEETTRVTNYLIQEKFIDHQRYASSFVTDKFRFNQWGKIKLAYALRMKHIEEQYVREALSGLPVENYHQVLLGLLTAKARTIREKDSYARRGKLLSFAQSRGFENDVALRIIEQLK